MTLIDDLRRSTVLAILRRPDIEAVAVDLYEKLRADGVRAVECTLDHEGAFEAIEAIRAVADEDTIVGAGTVMRIEQVDRLHDAGVAFAVSPHLDADLLRHARSIGFDLIPGVATPSEVARAVDLGATAVKLFPAGPLGIPYLEALLGPFRDLAVIPTGGIEVEDVPAWLDAGAVCVGLGGALTRGDRSPEALRQVLGGRS